ncbi:hypothetical protein C1634_018170 [Chryseobacterium viscerum]|uniref:Uncharacterized protein n=1 Tax=Chryseobacterium viscerum TaxID=1037377 RepID=A0A316WCU3_9FLAO|nr:hypothetical protein C1634_018170 [Chryseobacterium viscerum]
MNKIHSALFYINQCKREIGTIEPINVTPMKKRQLILGKLIPFWIVGMTVIEFFYLIALQLF